MVTANTPPNTTTLDQQEAIVEAYNKHIEFGLRDLTSFNDVAWNEPFDATTPGKNYTLFKYNELPLALTPLDEVANPVGTVIPENDKITITPAEYGDWTVLTFKLVNTTFDKWFVPSVADRLGHQMFMTKERLMENTLLTSPNKYASVADNKLVAGTEATATRGLSGEDLAAVVLGLKGRKAQPVGGYFTVIAHSSQIASLRSSTAPGSWRDVIKTANADEILNGTVSFYEGTRIVENNNITPIDVDGTNVYPTFVVGDKGLAKIAPEEGTIVLGGTIIDPLDRQTPIGWHAFLGYGLYYDEATAVIFSKA